MKLFVYVLIILSSSFIHAATVPVPKRNIAGKQKSHYIDDPSIKNNPNANQKSKSFDPTKYKFQNPRSMQKNPASTKPKPTPQQTRQMIEDAEIEAHNLKKIADAEDEHNLRRLMQHSTPVMPIEADSTIFFLGHRSTVDGQSMGNTNQNDFLQDEFGNSLNSHFVTLFENAISHSEGDTQGEANSLRKVTVLHSSFDNQDYFRVLHAVEQGILSFYPHTSSIQSKQESSRPITVVVIIGAEVVTERLDSSNLWEYRPMVEKLLTAIKRIPYVKQIVLTGLFLHGEHIASEEARANHPYHSAFQEWSSMLQHLARDYDIAHIDLLSPYEQFQRKINVGNIPHSLLTTVDGQHLSNLGHAFFAAQFLQAFHVKPPEALTSTIKNYIKDHFVQESDKQLLEKIISELSSKESSILQELSSQSADFIADNWRSSVEISHNQDFTSSSDKTFSSEENNQSNDVSANVLSANHQLPLGAFSVQQKGGKDVDSGENVFEL